MAISRRAMLAGAGLVATGLTASAGEACSLVASIRTIGFSDAACRRSLRRLIQLIIDAPKLTDAGLSERHERAPVRFEDGVDDPILAYRTDIPADAPYEEIDVIRAWSAAYGRPDRSPIAIREMNLLKSQKGFALYQFTLRRDQFHPATEEDGGSCFPSTEAHYGPEDVSYLGRFVNNQLRRILPFDEWLSEP